jgi:hypothetical protein
MAMKPSKHAPILWILNTTFFAFGQIFLLDMMNLG